MSDVENRSPFGTSRRGLLGLTGGVAAGAFLSACGGNDKGDNGGSGTKTLNLGWIQAEGGTIGPVYAPFYVGADLAVKEINAAGGIMGMQIKVEKYNDKGDAANEPAAIRALQSKCHFLVGPCGSSTAVAAVPAATTAKMIQNTFANATDLGDPTKYPYHYQIGWSAGQEGAFVTSEMIDKLGGTKIGILREDSAFGQDVIKSTMDELDGRGITPVSDQVYPFSTETNLQPYVEKLKNAGADAILFWGAFTPQIILAFKAMSALDWAPVVAGHSTLLQQSVVDGVDAKVLEKAYGLTYKSLTFGGDTTTPQKTADYVNSIVADPKTKGAEFVSCTSPFYDFVYVVKQGIEDAGSTDPDKVKDALNKLTNFQGALNVISFSDTSHHGVANEDLALGSLLSANDPQAQLVYRKALV
jgi:ABC-type branched-subunit amino acid transport system substrate-binding protein